MHQKINKTGYSQIASSKHNPISSKTIKKTAKFASDVIVESAEPIAIAVKTFYEGKNIKNFMFGNIDSTARHSSFLFFREALIKSSENNIGNGSVLTGYYNDVKEGEILKRYEYIENNANYHINKTTKKIYSSLEKADYNDSEWIQRHNNEMLNIARKTLHLRDNVGFTDYGKSLNTFIDDNLTSSDCFLSSVRSLQETANAQVDKQLSSVMSKFSNDLTANQLRDYIKDAKSGNVSITNAEMSEIRWSIKAKSVITANESKNIVRMLDDIYRNESILNRLNQSSVNDSIDEKLKSSLAEDEFSIFLRLKKILDDKSTDSVSKKVGVFMKENANKSGFEHAVRNILLKVSDIYNNTYKNVEIHASKVMNSSKMSFNNKTVYAKAIEFLKNSGKEEYSKDEFDIVNNFVLLQKNRAKMSLGDIISFKDSRLFNFNNYLKNNSDDLDDFSKNVIKNMEKINTSSGFSNGELELLTLLSTENQKIIKGTFKRYEEIIQLNVIKQLNDLEKEAISIIKDIKPNLVNKKKLSIKDLSDVLSEVETNKIRFSEDQKDVLRRLLSAKKDIASEKSKYIAGRISSGEIDIASIVASGRFCGLTLTDDMKTALFALETMASANKIVAINQNEILNKLGSKSLVTEIDMNDIKQVKSRINEFSEALTKSGISISDKHGFGGMTLKRLLKIDTLNFSDAQKGAFDELVKMKKHENVLNTAQSLKRAKRRLVTQETQKLFSSSDASLGVGELKRNMEMLSTTFKVYKLTFKAASFALPSTVKTKIKTSVKPILNLFDFKSNTVIQNAKLENRKISKAADITNSISNIESTKNKLKTTQKSNRQNSIQHKHQDHRYTSKAKKEQKNLVKKAGKQQANFKLKLNKVSSSAGNVKKLFKKNNPKKKSVKVVLSCLGPMSGIVASFLVIVLLLTALIPSTPIDGDSLNYYDDNDEPVNIIEYTKNLLQQLEIDSLINPTIEIDIDASDYRFFTIPLSGSEKITEEDVDKSAKSFLTYRLVDGEYVAVNSAETIKRILCMATFVTSSGATLGRFSQEPNADKLIYVNYSKGLWEYLNTPVTDIYLTVCDGTSNGCGEFTYYCNDKSIYQNSNRIVKQSGDKVYIVNGEMQPICLIGSDYVVQSANGCAVRKYFDDGRCIETYNDGTTKVLRVDETTLDFASVIYNLANNIYVKNAYMSTKGSNNPFCKSVGVDGYYLVNPIINSYCVAEIVPILKYIQNANSVLTFINNMTFHYDDKVELNCNNKKVVYCKGCVVAYHGTNMDTPCSCEDYTSVISGYKCNGHEIYDGTVYCSNEMWRTQEAGFIFNYIPEPCSNCEQYTSFNGDIIYNCKGHKQFTTVYCSEEDVVSLCDNKSTVVKYNCNGYNACEGHAVCCGHYVCQGHEFCNGHSAKYCKGHAHAQTMQIVNDKTDDVYNDSWSVTIDGKNYTALFFEEECFFSVKKDNTTYERGWSKDIKDYIDSLVDLDWYENFGISFANNVGGQYTKSEIQDLIAVYCPEYNTLSKDRQTVIWNALSSVGKVPYNPAGKATVYGYEGFGRPLEHDIVFENNGISKTISTTGLSKVYYADWIIWSSLTDSFGVPQRNQNLMKMTNLQFSFSEKFQPGDVVVFCNQDKKITETYIYIGRKNNKLSSFLVGMKYPWSGTYSTVLYNFNETYGFAKVQGIYSD